MEQGNLPGQPAGANPAEGRTQQSAVLLRKSLQRGVFGPPPS